ncbi:hypothetical protein PMAYCL1PPCAC_21128, partial [Pristionchus mayeri]
KVIAMRSRKGVIPISNEEVQTHPRLNTKYLTKKTFDILTASKISKSRFAKAVLGLNTGQPIMERMKEWHQLNTPGRRNFIRMKLFLEEISAAIENDDDYDVFLLVRRVKYRLHFHGISQPFFGQYVLGVDTRRTYNLLLSTKKW